MAKTQVCTSGTCAAFPAPLQAEASHLQRGQRRQTPAPTQSGGHTSAALIPVVCSECSMPAQFDVLEKEVVQNKNQLTKGQNLLVAKTILFLRFG